MPTNSTQARLSDPAHRPMNVPRKTPGRSLLWFLPGAAVFLLGVLFTPAGASRFISGDVTVYLLNAARMLEGQAIYKDFFQYTTPGTELVYFVLFRLFGPRAWIPNAMLFALGLSVTWLSIAISRKLVPGWLPFLSALLFLTCSFYKGLDGGHHWYSVLAVMAAVAIIIEQRSPMRVAGVGALCGLALFFTQIRGLAAVLGFAAFLVWEHRRKAHTWAALLKTEAYLLGAFLATVVSTNAYFVWRAGVKRFLFCTVVFGSRYYPAYSLGNSLKTYLFSPPSLRPWYGLPFVLVYALVHLLVPLVYLLTLVRYWREAQVHSEYPWDRVMLVSIAGLSLFLGVAPAPSFFRLSVVSLPALILLVWLLSLPGRPERVLAGLLWVFAVLLVALEPLRTQRHRNPYMDLPSGRVALLEPDLLERYRWVADHTRPSDFFFEADWSDTYVALGLRNPTPVPFVTNTDYTRPEQVRDVIDALEKRDVRFVLWSWDLDTPQGDLAGDHLGPLRFYLRTRYHVVKTFADGDQVWQIWQRKS